MFVNVSSYYEQFWPYTFPDLSPLEKDEIYQPIEPAENLYSLNGIESVATAMGASTPAGRNAALLIRKKWQKSLS